MGEDERGTRDHESGTSLSVIRQIINDHGIDTVVVGGTDVYGVFRGKRVPVAQFLRSAEHDGIAFSDSPFFAFELEEDTIIPPRPGVSGWFPRFGNGYGDVFARPDLGTFTPVLWFPGTAVCLTDLYLPDGTPIEIHPRAMLKQAIQKARSMGFEPDFAAELEFFLFRERPETIAAKRHTGLDLYAPWRSIYGVLRGSMDEPILGQLRRGIEGLDIPIEAVNPEGALGQYEMNIRYGPALQAADQAFLLRNGVKEIAHQNGLTATFMAKPTAAEWGSSCHLHQSLRSVSTGENAFFDSTRPHNVSDTMRHYIGGVLATMRDFALLYAPFVNSYRRFVGGSFAATSVTWSIDNRTTGLRAVTDHADGCRIENRMPGANANPYLAIAGCLMAGLYGIEHRVEPGDPYIGNAYEDPGVPSVPRTFDEAIELFDGSAIARQTLGDYFVESYLSVKEYERDMFRQTVTDWEVRRYLERL